MKFDLSDIKETEKAFERLAELSGREALVEIKKLSPNRSLNQNAYLHLLLSAFGAHFGYSLEEAKAVYKELNANIYRYEKKDRVFWRSSADLSKEDMAKSLDILHRRSADAGYPLPPATDVNWLRQLENTVEQANYYL